MLHPHWRCVILSAISTLTSQEVYSFHYLKVADPFNRFKKGRSEHLLTPSKVTQCHRTPDNVKAFFTDNNIYLISLCYISLEYILMYFYANDIVLFSTSPSTMQRMLNIYESFSEAICMKYNCTNA